jgi:hypothetical protein
MVIMARDSETRISVTRFMIYLMEIPFWETSSRYVAFSKPLKENKCIYNLLNNIGIFKVQSK